MKYISGLKNVLSAILILCTSAIAADPANGPLFGIWHIDGHGYQWQVDQINAGLPMEPCVRLEHPFRINPDIIDNLNADAPMLSQFDGMPIVLRCHNITFYVDKYNERIPIEELPDRWQESHLSIRVHPVTGELDDTPTPTPWCPSDEAWRNVGRNWTPPWFERLQEIVPNPAGIILRENNEGAILKLESFVVVNNFRALNPANGKIIWPTAATPVEWYLLEEPPEGTQWFIEPKPGNTSGHLRAVRWASDDECDGIDLHAKCWVGPRRDHKPNDADAQALRELYTPFYHALYEELRASWGDAWRSVPFRTIGYGGPAENYANDASSSQFYMGFYRDPVLTNPEHQAWLDDRRTLNWDTLGPTGWAELSIQQSARCVFQGALDGAHDAVDPESYSGFMAYTLWTMQAPGREVRLTYYDSYRTPPTELTFPVGHPFRQSLTAIGRDDLAELTISDWEVAVMERMRFIHEQPIVNRYWRDGTTTILDSADNDASAHRVYATETKIGNGKQTLLCVYTPCSAEQLPEIRVGEYVLPWRRFAYWLTNGVVEIE